MVKNQAKIPHFWLRYFDKKTALPVKAGERFVPASAKKLWQWQPAYVKTSAATAAYAKASAATIGLMFEDVLQISGL
jgi:hypothetical protein